MPPEALVTSGARASTGMVFTPKHRNMLSPASDESMHYTHNFFNKLQIYIIFFKSKYSVHGDLIIATSPMYWGVNFNIFASYIHRSIVSLTCLMLQRITFYITLHLPTCQPHNNSIMKGYKVLGYIFVVGGFLVWVQSIGLNMPRPRQNGHHFADNIFIFFSMRIVVFCFKFHLNLSN